jgi:hypothetical protein
MRTRVMKTMLLSLALVGLAALAQAQAPPASPSPDVPKAETSDIGKSILEQELEPPPGGYTYNAQGRRDPFISMIKPVAPQGSKGVRPQGFPGFLIQEVALRGIVKTSEAGIGSASKAGYIAVFQGADPTKSFFVTVGQRLFDGVITAIDATSVTFRQEVTDPLSPVKTRDVRKSLYASEEARQ